MEAKNGRWALRQLGMAVLSIALFCAAVQVTLAIDFEFVPPSLLLAAGLIVAVAAVRQSPKTPWRATLQLAFAWLLFGFLTTIQARPGSDRYMKHTACMSNVKQQSLGMLIYAADFDDRLPLADSWHAGTQPSVGVDREFHCPYATSAWSYAMNRTRSGAETAAFQRPDTQVLLFEVEAALPNASGGPESMVFRHAYREEKRTMVGFVDGHAMANNSAQAVALKW